MEDIEVMNVSLNYLFYINFELYPIILAKYRSVKVMFLFSNALQQLMGVEACDTGDHECLKRRIISEAHLDYIYTQHHRP